jgi:hypothetical protein
MQGRGAVLAGERLRQRMDLGDVERTRVLLYDPWELAGGRSDGGILDGAVPAGQSCGPRADVRVGEWQGRDGDGAAQGAGLQAERSSVAR